MNTKWIKLRYISLALLLIILAACSLVSCRVSSDLKADIETEKIQDSAPSPEKSEQGAPEGEKTALSDSPEETGKEERYGWPATREIYDLFRQINRDTAKPGDELSRVRVFLKEQILAAYGKDQDKEKLLRVMPISSGYVSGHTLPGAYHIGRKNHTNLMFDGSIGLYSCQIYGNILFHSLTSYDGSPQSGLKISDINSMGIAASHGCVRLFTADAKWLYERMPAGTPVDILEERGESYQDLPEFVHYLRLKEGAPAWDPSNPDKDNPYLDYQVFEKWVMEEPWKNFKFQPPDWSFQETSAETAMPVVPVNPTPTEMQTEDTQPSERQAVSTTDGHGAQTETGVYYHVKVSENSTGDGSFSYSGQSVSEVP